MHREQGKGRGRSTLDLDFLDRFAFTFRVPTVRVFLSLGNDCEPVFALGPVAFEIKGLSS